MEPKTNTLRRDHAEVASHVAAQLGRGLFLQAFELASLRYYIQRADVPDASESDTLALLNYVSALLGQRDLGPIEFLVVVPDPDA
jgi:hypothetical protein